MTFCDKCGREIVWGVTETSGERIAFDAWAERRYMFLYGPADPTCRSIDTWNVHRCPPFVAMAEFETPEGWPRKK